MFDSSFLAGLLLIYRKPFTLWKGFFNYRHYLFKWMINIFTLIIANLTAIHSWMFFLNCLLTSLVLLTDNWIYQKNLLVASSSDLIILIIYLYIIYFLKGSLCDTANNIFSLNIEILWFGINAIKVII